MLHSKLARHLLAASKSNSSSHRGSNNRTSLAKRSQLLPRRPWYMSMVGVLPNCATPHYMLAVTFYQRRPGKPVQRHGGRQVPLRVRESELITSVLLGQSAQYSVG